MATTKTEWLTAFYLTTHSHIFLKDLRTNAVDDKNRSHTVHASVATLFHWAMLPPNNTEEKLYDCYTKH